VALTAGRGRGKSAALGIALAGALASGYANVFVTSPSPENLRTLFDFLFRGLDALGYKEHIDYDLVESANPAFNKAVVRVNVFRDHRQTVQYVAPQHAERVAAAELLIIDEAASIPLPTVRALLGPYLVFLCSTVNGYEGTGRSLSLKLIAQLREQGAKRGAPLPAAGGGGGAAAGGRLFKEIVLSEPIRYAAGDRVERWLNDLLCLDAAEKLPSLAATRLPHPDECELFAVNRDTLFSGHRDAESFLQRLMALYVASHYRNSPNDLQMLSDAPAHRLFALLPPVDAGTRGLPDVLAVVQVALEGAISRQSAAAQLAAGAAPGGDLIPWTVSQQFQDADFPGLTGARVVRIAVHPELPRLGYGSRALAQLAAFYAGQLRSLGDEDGGCGDGDGGGGAADALVAEPAAPCVAPGGGLLQESLRPRRGLPPLLSSLSERQPERVHWLGAAYGLSQELFNFWRRAGYSTLYLRQTPSDVTGECSTLALREIFHVGGDDGGGAPAPPPGWLAPFASDFRVRYASLLAGAFRGHAPALALSLLQPRLNWSEAESAAGAPPSAVPRADGRPLSPHDLRRLASYCGAAADHHLIRDLVPPLARAYLGGSLPATLSHAQAALLVVLGLQQRELADAEAALGLPASQVLALFNKAMRRLLACLNVAEEARAAAALPAAPPPGAAAAAGARLQPHPVGLDDDLADGAAAVAREQQRQLLQALDVRRYAITGDDADWGAALAGRAAGATGLLSVKRKPTAAAGEASAEVEAEVPRERRKHGASGKKSKAPRE
jgi:N-acetyltransferase 10